VKNQHGLTLVEVLVAASIVAVGLTAVAAGLQYAVAAVEAGRRQTIALFLAEEKLEQVKAVALVDFEAVTAANFPAEEPVAGHPQYGRVVEITPSPAGTANAVRVQVRVVHRPGATGSVSLATVLSRRQ
jgi:prepilin-type N-terminal cleavage/methylation domain-containing protein